MPRWPPAPAYGGLVFHPRSPAFCHPDAGARPGGPDARAAEDRGPDRGPGRCRDRRGDGRGAARLPAAAWPGNACSAPPRSARASACPSSRRCRWRSAPISPRSHAYEDVADMLLFDAKAARRRRPRRAAMARPSTGKCCSGRSFRRPWFLAGGLDAGQCRARHRACRRADGGCVVRRGKRARREGCRAASPISSSPPARILQAQRMNQHSQFLSQRPRCMRPFRRLWRTLRRRDADAAGAVAGAGL